MMTDTDKRPRGRPPLDHHAMLVKINIRLPDDVMREIEAIRMERRDGSSSSQVIRELIVASLRRMRERQS